MQSKDILRESFKAYYGANCHAYARGTFRKVNNYDVNSLYPFVMCNEYPDPNFQRLTYQNTDLYIWKYHGCSDITISIPYSENKPLLPFHIENKTLFPVGEIRGWYTHVEIRKAIELGYTLKKVHKTIYYKESMFPFREMMLDLWDLRNEYKKNNSPMESVVKLLMNNLYGKTGQKFDAMEEWLPIDQFEYKELIKMDFIEKVGNFIRIKKNNDPAPYCIPIWASYTTAYGRMVLYDYIKRCDPLYVDTDSLYTFKEMETNPSKLGALKHENKGIPLKEVIIVKPKFYMKDGFARIKGISKMNEKMFRDALQKKPLAMQKWVKFKEGKRRNLRINEILLMYKSLSLEDNKRNWNNQFNYKDCEYSEPLCIENGNIASEVYKNLKSHTDKQLVYGIASQIN